MNNYRDEITTAVILPCMVHDKITTVVILSRDRITTVVILSRNKIHVTVVILSRYIGRLSYSYIKYCYIQIKSNLYLNQAKAHTHISRVLSNIIYYKQKTKQE